MAFQWELVSFDSWDQVVIADDGVPVLTESGDPETVLVTGEEWVTVHRHPRLRELGWKRGDLEAAAREAATCVQRELHERSPVDRLEAILLDHARHLYCLALYEISVYRFGRKRWKFVKEIEAESSPDCQALAICLGTWGSSVVRKLDGIGSRSLVTVETSTGVKRSVPLGPYGGCLQTFVDRFSRGNSWPTWCPDCRTAKTNARRAAIVALRRDWANR